MKSAKDLRKTIIIAGAASLSLASSLVVAPAIQGGWTTQTDNSVSTVATQIPIFTQQNVTDYTATTKVGPLTPSSAYNAAAGADTRSIGVQLADVMPEVSPNTTFDSVFIEFENTSSLTYVLFAEPKLFEIPGASINSIRVVDSVGAEASAVAQDDIAGAVSYSIDRDGFNIASSTSLNAAATPIVLESIFSPGEKIVVKFQYSIGSLAQEYAGFGVNGTWYVYGDADMEPPAAPAVTLSATNQPALTATLEDGGAAAGPASISEGDAQPISLQSSARMAVGPAAAVSPYTVEVKFNDNVYSSNVVPFEQALPGVQKGGTYTVEARACNEIRVCNDWMPLEITVPTDADACAPYSLVNGSCKETEAASEDSGTTYSCNSGDSLSGTTCTTTTTSYYYYCNSGDSLSGSTCTTTTSTPYYYCNSGDSLSGSTCSYIASYSYSCPSGYYIDGSLCRENGYPLQAWVCPDGWTRVTDSTCSRNYTVMGTGPTGTTCSTLRSSFGNPPGWSGTWNSTTQKCTYSYTATETQNNATQVTRYGQTTSRIETPNYSTYNATLGYSTSTSTYGATLGSSTSSSNYAATGTPYTNYLCRPGFSLTGTDCNRVFTVPVFTRTASSV